MNRHRPLTHCGLGLLLALLALLVASPVSAQDLATFEKRLTERRLDNGLTFLIYERPGAPIVSFQLWRRAWWAG